MAKTDYSWESWKSGLKQSPSMNLLDGFLRKKEVDVLCLRVGFTDNLIMVLFSLFVVPVRTGAEVSDAVDRRL